jgi:hypothetical protein
VSFALVASAVSGPLAPVVEPDTRLVLEDKPTNAAKVFQWGLSAWEDEFRPEVKFKRKRWSSNIPSRVGQQIGMLTLKAGPNTDLLWTTATDHKRRYGRWEARVRTKVFERGNAQYRVFFELIPAGPYRCGAKNLVLATYKPKSPIVSGYKRTLDNNQFSFQVDPEATTAEFHTFAIEVTPDHVTWFVDKKPRMTERRDAALPAYRYKVRFRMVQENPSVVHNESWLQMDWVRYYTLERPNAKSIAAPESNRGTYSGAC